MYHPQPFRVSDPATLFAFMEQYSFAALVSTLEGAPFASHLPLIVDRDHAPQGAILGHMARANPHWQAFDGSQEVLTIFLDRIPASRRRGRSRNQLFRPGTMRLFMCTASLGLLKITPGCLLWLID